MCGILGSINLNFDEDVLNLIAKRGPDSAKIENIKIGNHEILYGHRRLAILELSPAGEQPMFSSGRKFGIIHNGEIYNHHSIRNLLHNINFKGHSDTETILYAIAEKGIKIVSNFNGIFGFSFYNALQQKLFIVRDAFGVKPVYYFHKDNKFAFCSEIKPLLKLCRPELDIANLAQLLHVRYIPSPDTLFNNIKKIRPGHYIEIDLSKQKIIPVIKTYITPVKQNTKISYQEALQEYGRLFENAVKHQLMADVDIGLLLSGGIDSALVSHFAQKYSTKSLNAYTVGFTEQDDSDETKDAAETASFLGLNHNIVKIGFSDFFNQLENCIKIVEEPLATTSLIPMYYLSELAAKDVKVVLTGQGADEPLGGYRRYKGELINKYFPSFFASNLDKICKISRVKSERVLRALSIFGENTDRNRFLSAYSVFSNNEIERLIGRKDNLINDKINYYYRLLQVDKFLQPVERMMSIDLRMNLADDLLIYTDKITMHHSLECRVPILDLELIRFIESLPAKYRVQFFNAKKIHKSFAKKILPASIINRKKKGFLSPTKQWFKNDKLLKEILCEKNSLMKDYFNTEEIENVINEHNRGFNRERHIFLLLGINYWLKNFL